jgi:leader peptidase (prepilin peptidase)/N-methyltransferase
MALLILILGLILGSYFNVLIYRLPGDLALGGERSMCPKCGTILKPLDLIPVLSWIMLRARCRYCNERISFQYPLVELTSALFVMLAYYRYGIGLEMALQYIFMSSALIIALIDIRTQTIPDKISIPMLIVFLLSSLFRGANTQPYSLDLDLGIHCSNLVISVLGAAACGGFLLLLAELSNGKMGGGDIKYIASVGAYLGWYQTILVLLFGSILGLMGTFTLIKLGKVNRKQPIPFGPYLAAAGIIVSNIPLYAIIFPH